MAVARRRPALPAGLWLVALAAVGAARAEEPAATAGARDCAPVSQWREPGAGGPRPLATAEVFARAATARVVLLGETHDSAEHHRWQLQVLAGLHAGRPQLVLALEMFPRRVQPALDRWVAGETDEATFLAEADWRQVWSFNPSLYLPLFHFARMNRLPMVAVNVDRPVIRAIGERGLSELPPEDREGVDDPAPAADGYLDMLHGSWRDHLPLKPDGTADDRESGEFRRFVESQLFWDRAMALGIAAAAARSPDALVVGLMGSGHVVNGWGVPAQLADLGVAPVLSLLPWDQAKDCARLVAGYADAVFGLDAPPRPPAPPRARLGVTLEAAGGRVRIASIAAGSVAETARLRVGDVIVTLGGTPVATPGEAAEAIARQAPGSWLPIRIERGRRSLERVAKFPPAAASLPQD